MTNDALQELLSSVDHTMILRELAERSLYEFIKQAWRHIEPGVEYRDNWHIEAMCEHLQAVAEGRIRRLIINIPPRHMKSIVVSVMFPVWCWINQAHLKFLFASYGGSLSIRDSTKCRRLIQSQWFQRNWGDRFQLTGDQNQKSRFENDHTGYRLATSVGGALIGEGGDIICVDDPHNTMEVESEKIRQGVLDWWDNALQSRLNDPKKGAFIVIMQRLHESDLVGHILKDDPDHEWDLLCIPARYEKKHPFMSRSSLGFYDPRKEEGEILWPERFGADELDRLAKAMGTYAAAGQLQQRPSPKGGGILKKKDWQEWTLKDVNGQPQLPDISYVMQSWDTSYSDKDDAAYQARTTWGIFRHKGRWNAILTSYWRDHCDYPALRRKAKEIFQEEKPDAVLVEKKASGQSLIKDLRMSGIPVITYTPDRDKVARAHSASALLEAGMVWYVDKKWAHEVIDHCAKFPAGDGADVVDTVTQALIRLRNMWYLEHPEDADDTVVEDKPKVVLYG